MASGSIDVVGEAMKFTAAPTSLVLSSAVLTHDLLHATYHLTLSNNGTKRGQILMDESSKGYWEGSAPLKFHMVYRHQPPSTGESLFA